MEDGTGPEDHDGIGRLIEDFGRSCEVLCVVSPVVEFVVQELQEAHGVQREETQIHNRYRVESCTTKGGRGEVALAPGGVRRARSIAEQFRVRMDDFARNHVKDREKQLVYVYL